VPYPDRLLADDEKVVKHLHPHWITLVVPVLVFLLTLGIAGFLLAIIPDGSLQPAARIAVGVIAAAILIWLAVVPFLRWRTTHYVLTTHRLMIRTGILHHHGKDIPLNRINNVLYEQSLWDRIVNAGTLMVESAGETGQQVFANIPNADRNQQLINRLVEQDHDRRVRESAEYEARAEVEYETRARERTTERLDDR
jgi:uncharacterized membrane protein YdbT with pleckstrin-like domain